MEIFLVGGAVRDRLLGEAVKDRDWVVVGARPEDLIARGFRQVGRDFPVFIDPESGEEYALARTERKTAPGYRGFDVDASPGVSLEDDLGRRDLTINAMAESSGGVLVDPYGGQQDLEQRLLRHVSPAFSEDPVRVLRVARFAARYAHLGFRVADETLALMAEMVDAGEVDALVSERIWLDLDKALGEPTPSAFVVVLRQCGALARILPEVDALFGVPQPARHHPEIDTGEHLLLTLDAAAAMGASSRVVFACLLHDLGKALTPREHWPAHHGHEQTGIAAVSAVCARLRCPNDYRSLALRVCENHLRAHRALELRATTVLKLILAVDGLRQPDRFKEFLQACHADLRGRSGRQQEDYPQGEFLARALEAAAAVPIKPLLDRGLSDRALGEALQQARVAAISELISDRAPQ